jgi:hypothetical protein
MRLAVFLAATLVLIGAALPRTGPIPLVKPAEKAEPQSPAKAPEPSTSDAKARRPDGATPENKAPEANKTPETAAPTVPELPNTAEVPTPLPKPGEPKPEGKAPAAEPPATTTTDTGPKPDGKEKEEEKAETPPPPPPPPLVKEDPEELKACLAELGSLGARFEPTDPIDDGNGCGIEHPIDVAEILPGVDVGGATMRCKTAVSLAHWLKDTVQPALNIAMPGRKITGLVPGSTYACRLRNSASTGKISEHARGNAFDVAAFKLDNGEKMTMKPRDEDSTMEGAFQRTATSGACLHFTTVLSPGSDAAHQNHLHLDVLERKGGYRYCR